MSNELSWKEKAKQTKMRYDQLFNLRHTAIQADIKDLKKKIQEHKEAHEATINEIKSENLLLIDEIAKIRSSQESIIKFKQEIDYLKNKLRVVDTILNCILDYGFLAVKYIGPSHYRVHCIDNDDIIFELFKGKKTTTYRPIRIPSSQLFYRFKQEVQVPDLHVFCKELHRILYQ